MAAEGFNRKLAAILSADVAGYSRLMGDDEEATVRTLTAYREVFTNLIQQHKGRVIDSPGDNLLVEFASVLDAVQCAVAVQKEIKARNDDFPENRKMQFRIGINLGDVIQEEGRIYGDGVNIAARLEAMAQPGGITISGDVFRQVDGKIDLALEELGEQKVKNIQKPVQVYRVEHGPGKNQLPAADRAALELPVKASIAVLPFDNMSGDPKQDFLADGLTEDIITDLSRFRDLFVIARNSTFTYKGKPVKVQEVAEELKVRFVLEGSIQRSGDRVRITAQLIDATTGEHVWADRYDRNISDIFVLQDEVTEKIVGNLSGYHGKLTRVEKLRAKKKGSANLKVYETYLQGIEHKHRFTPENNLIARQLLEKAIGLDPDYARAYIALAWTYLFEVWWGWTDNPQQALEQAFEAAHKAATLDEWDAECHWVMADLCAITSQFEKAVAEYNRALELNPNFADVLADWGMFQARLGRAKESLETIRKAMRLNPNYPDWYTQFLGGATYAARQYEEAISVLKMVKQHTRVSRAYLAASYAQLGRMKEASAEAAETLKLDPHTGVSSISNVEYYTETADRDHFEAGMRKAGLPENSTS
jgi:adenylate cyclase